MDVRCSRCGTEYQFEEARLEAEPVTVKCSTCGLVFNVRREDAQHARPGRNNWMVRQRDGSVQTFKDLTTLQKWIVERKVTRDDEISKSGENWKRLGSISELSSFFQVVDGPHGAQPGGAGPAITAGFALPPMTDPTAPGGLSPATVLVPAPMGSTLPPTATSLPPVHSDVLEDGDLDDDDPVLAWQRSQRRRNIMVGLGILVMAGAGAVFMALPTLQTAWESFNHAVGKRPEPAVGAIEAGYRAWLRGSGRELKTAEGKALQALDLVPEDADGLALRSLVQASRGMMAEEQKRDSGGDLFKEAFSFAERAMEKGSDRGLPNLAAAFYYVERLPAEAQAYVERAGRSMPLGDPVVRLVAAELRAISPATRTQALDEMGEVVKQHPDLLLARYRLAYWLTVERQPSAKAHLEVLLKLEPQHERARELLNNWAPPPVQGAASASRAEPVAAESSSLAAESPSSSASNGNGASSSSSSSLGEDRPKGKLSYDKLLALADRQRDNGQTQKALASYMKASEMEPDRPEPHVGLGWCFIDQEKFGAALGEFDRALQLNSGYAEAYVGLGEVYKYRGDKFNAVKNYQKYLSLMPDGPEAPVARQNLQQLK